MARGFYPEQKDRAESKLDRIIISGLGNATSRFRVNRRRFNSIVEEVRASGAQLKSMSDAKLSQETLKLRRDLMTHGFRFDLVAKAFAIVREVADRKLGMRHFDVQLIGGWVLLNGMIAEMETGEGKTITATLPACTVAMAGIPVHIITVNDYLAKRDAEWMAPIYEALGLSVGTIVQGMTIPERRRAYGSDITYCTNKEVTFDFLKDRLIMGRRPGEIQVRLERLYGVASRVDRLCLRGLCFAIVDEADSVLIDEARTPLIISGVGDNSYENEVYQQALELAAQLRLDEDYTVDLNNRQVELTDDGKENLELLANQFRGIWSQRRHREELVHQALVAKTLFHKDKDYLIREGKIQIIDEYTGRLMPDRSWERGLHQLIESKEYCDVTSQNEVLARISYQRFFRRYLYLAGMTGTASEVTRELWSVYRLNVVKIPTNKPVRRTQYLPKIFRTFDEKWSAVVSRISEMHAKGRPVLVGTRSVAASEHLSTLLTNEGLAHRVLNARQDSLEAEIIAQAGHTKQITVATNMAGRGTDIILGPFVTELGGLHVIATERHDARRIDRQLFGRCGRQGDPGSFESFASLQDEILAVYAQKIPACLINLLTKPSAWGKYFAGLLASTVQRLAERRHFLIRRDLMKFDEMLDTAMAFSGKKE